MERKILTILKCRHDFDEFGIYVIKILPSHVNNELLSLIFLKYCAYYFGEDNG